MVMFWSLGVVEDLQNGIVTRLGSAGKVNVYAGEVFPAGPTVDVSEMVLLATLDLPDPAGTVTDGVLTLGAIPPTTAVNYGRAGYVQFVDDADVFVFDSAPGTGGLIGIQFNTLDLWVGASVTVESAVYGVGYPLS